MTTQEAKDLQQRTIKTFGDYLVLEHHDQVVLTLLMCQINQTEQIVMLSEIRDLIKATLNTVADK